jgi:hypothetical protein
MAQLQGGPQEKKPWWQSWDVLPMLGAIGGSALGSILAPGIGTIGGGAAGAGLGETLEQKLTGQTNPKGIAGEALMGGVAPVVGGIAGKVLGPIAGRILGQPAAEAVGQAGERAVGGAAQAGAGAATEAATGAAKPNLILKAVATSYKPTAKLLKKGIFPEEVLATIGKDWTHIPNTLGGQIDWVNSLTCRAGEGGGGAFTRLVDYMVPDLKPSMPSNITNLTQDFLDQGLPKSQANNLASAARAQINKSSNILEAIRNVEGLKSKFAGSPAALDKGAAQVYSKVLAGLNATMESVSQATGSVQKAIAAHPDLVAQAFEKAPNLTKEFVQSQSIAYPRHLQQSLYNFSQILKATKVGLAQPREASGLGFMRVLGGLGGAAGGFGMAGPVGAAGGAAAGLAAVPAMESLVEQGRIPATMIAAKAASAVGGGVGGAISGAAQPSSQALGQLLLRGAGSTFGGGNQPTTPTQPTTPAATSNLLSPAELGAQTSTEQPLMSKEQAMQLIALNPKMASVISAMYQIGQPETPKALTSGQQTMLANAASGLRAIDTMDQVLSKEGSMAIWKSKIPVVSGQSPYATASKEVADVLTRLRTGAQLNAQEQAFYQSQLPQPLDNQQTIQYKLNLFRNLFNTLGTQATQTSAATTTTQ